MSAPRPRIAVIGSVNLDIVATADRLPGPGETVTGARLARHPGGKGANQALAARRLGAEVALLAAVGRDAAADEALALLRAEGVDLSRLVRLDEPTGVALIAVAADGENQIVVASGANAAFAPDLLPDFATDAVMCQLEIPVETVAVALARAPFTVLNLAPASPVPADLLARASLVVANEGEAAAYGAALDARDGLTAVTLGARGAVLKRRGAVVAEAEPPRVRPTDTTGAGDVFVAALTVGLLEGRTATDALAFACAAGAAATLKPGAQPSFPTRAEVEALALGPG